MPTLDSLLSLVAKHHPFDASKYPSLLNADDHQKMLFGLNHNALHFAKTAGKIAAVLEGFDHGAALDVAELKNNMTKSLINTLRLALLLNVSAEELAHAVEGRFAKTGDGAPS